MHERQPCTDVARATSAPDVSVVVPAYNSEDTIRRTLDSARAQSCKSITEIIVVDDGSEDATSQIVRDEYPEVRIITQKNQGSAVARNTGVEVAEGELIAFLDADDEWLPEKIQCHCDFHRRFPGIHLSISDSRMVDDPVSAEDNDAIQIRHLRFRDVINLRRMGFRYGCTGWVIRRQTFSDVGGFRAEIRRGQDSELLWRLAYRGYGIALITKVLFVYYPSFKRRSSESVRKAKLIWEEHVDRVLREHLGTDEDRPFRWLSEAETNNVLADSYIVRGRRLWEAGDRKKAREYFVRATELSSVRGLDRLRLLMERYLPGLSQWIMEMRSR